MKGILLAIGSMLLLSSLFIDKEQGEAEAICRFVSLCQICSVVRE